MNVPAVRIARNLKRIGHSDLGGAPSAGEGMGVKITPDGRRNYFDLARNDGGGKP